MFMPVSNKNQEERLRAAAPEIYAELDTLRNYLIDFAHEHVHKAWIQVLLDKANDIKEFLNAVDGVEIYRERPRMITKEF